MQVLTIFGLVVFGQETKFVPPPLVGTAVRKAPRFNGDDIYYPLETIQKYANAGMDVSDLRIAHLMESSGELSRGLETATEWSEMTEQGLIALPWAVEATFPHEDLIDKHMVAMEADLGCFDAIKVDTAELGTT